MGGTDDDPSYDHIGLSGNRVMAGCRFRGLGLPWPTAQLLAIIS
jgi:hypothetical protein